MKLLMVCLGNICRSPLAQGIMEDKIAREGLAWVVDSAGTGHWHVGENPDTRSIHVAAKKGIDISHQRARKFTPNDFLNFDLILTMDDQNYEDVTLLAPDELSQKKVKSIMDFYSGPENIIPDPYWDDSLFPVVFDLLDRVCSEVIGELQIRSA